MEDQGDRSPVHFSTPMIHGRLRALIADMGVRPLPRSVRLKELCDWTIHELPKVAPDDPRTDQAVRLARVLWNQARGGI